MTSIRTHIVRDWKGGHRLILVQDRPGGKIGVISDFIQEEYGEGERFDSDSGIGIVNKAWDAGFRPVGYADVKNETDALRSHRDDLRMIAFHTLGIKS